MALRWLHLRNISYAHADRLQNILAGQHLAYKSLPPDLRAQAPVPPPYLLTFVCPPTYTYGRREIRDITAAELKHLAWGGRAAVHAARRGGQVTWHGPGQLTAFVVLSLDRHGLRPASHVHMLEQVVIDFCAHLPDRHKVSCFRDPARPGVWSGDPPRKLAAVGVHLRRNVSLYGLGLNVMPELVWFERIRACGLPGTATTMVADEAAGRKARSFFQETWLSPMPWLYSKIIEWVPMKLVARDFARRLASALESGPPQAITEKVVLAIEKEIGRDHQPQDATD